MQWNEQTPLVMKKMTEYAYGAVSGKAGKLLFVNFITQVSPACDCYGHNDRPVSPDVGILASDDPVAIDQACVDLVIRASGIDPFRATHPSVDWAIQLSCAEELGLGTRDYRLESL